ncbi:AraC family transcriptional regulator [bacterium]|nr:AraC family transcriptional regulator [bacterium]
MTASEKPKKPTATIGLINRLLEITSNLGFDSNDLLAVIDLDVESLQDPNRRVPLEKLFKITEAAVRLTGDDALGIHAGESIRPGLFHIVGYIAMNSRTVREALGHYIRYEKLICENDRIVLQEQENRATIFLDFRYPETGYFVYRVEAVIVTWIVYIRWITGTDVIPIQVFFKHPQPLYVDEYHRVFRAPLKFESDITGLELENSVLDLPLVEANQDLLVWFEKQAGELLANLQSEQRLTVEITNVVINRYQGKDPGAGEVAEKLGLSVRSLHRKLQQENTTYKGIINKCRKDMALQYLSNKDLAIYEIAFLLGYSETSAFYRAFKRWTGTSPSNYRK